MWTCPKCGREFARTNQGHYCGKAPETVEEYTQSQSPEAHAHLIELRNIVRRSVPDVSERIAWSMPRYEKDGHAISFAACKKHVSLYLDPDALETFRPQLGEFTIKKNAIYLPYDRPLPVPVLEDAIRQSFPSK